MSYFPFFREIEGEKCLVIGGGKVAARKISRLKGFGVKIKVCLLYTSPSPRDGLLYRMPSSA